MIRCVGTVGLVGLLVLSVPAYGQDSPSGAAAFDQFKSMGAATSVLGGGRDPAITMLKKRVETVDWQDTPFEEVITWLKDEGGSAVNIVPRWAPLGVEGIDRDTLVTLQLNNSTIGEVLAELLETLSEDGEVRFRAWGNTLRISTRADFERKRFLRVYDATDIMLRIPDFGRGAPVIDLQNAGGQGGGGGQSVFSGSSGGQEEQTGGEQAEQDLQERLERMATLIRDVIGPNTWSQAGSAGGTGGGQNVIRVFNRSLVVYAPIEIHEQIGGMFAYGG
jgi:hypothetical protein